jgi:glycosyltransferase involved in cell wall biosynthesis
VCHLHHKPNFRRTKELSLGVAHFIAVSNFMRDSWVETGIKPERISVVDNAVPKLQYPRGGIPERAAAREKLGIDPDVVVVLYYGWITQEKGVGTLLEAWARLGRDADRARLVLVGSPLTSEDAELDRQLRSIAPSSIQWFPMQSDVTIFLHAADLVVFPTWLDEGFGRVVIEGMSTGRPVIASRVGAVPEILSGPMARFLVEPRDSNELSAKIASLLDWRRTEPELAAACANWVDERYPFDGHVKAVEEVLLRYRRGRR